MGQGSVKEDTCGPTSEGSGCHGQEYELYTEALRSHGRVASKKLMGFLRTLTAVWRVGEQEMG